MTTYRKFDRFRAHSAFATNESDFNTTAELGLFTLTGVGTPVALALGTDGGAALVTSAASGDSAVVQRGTGSAKLADIPLRKGKKFSLVGRVEMASFANTEVNFGPGPSATNPFTGTGSVYMSLKHDGTYTVNAGSLSASGEIDLAAERDRWGGIELEVYWDGAGKIGFFVNGKRIGGFDVSFTNDDYVSGLPNPLCVSAGIVSRSAAAKTAILRRVASALQIAPYPRGV